MNTAKYHYQPNRRLSLMAISNINRALGRKVALLAGASLAAAAAFPAVSSAAPAVVELDVPVPHTNPASPSAPISGSYIRISTPDKSFYVPNPNIYAPPAGDGASDLTIGSDTILANRNSLNTYTPLYPSNIGPGLKIDDGFQPDQVDPVDGSGIVDPVLWSGLPFDVFTVSTDHWGGKAGTFPTPTLIAAGNLTDDLRSWSINYGTGLVPGAGSFHYNQGADATAPPTAGTNLSVSTAGSGTPITLDWSSPILGDSTNYTPATSDPFNGLVGTWHIEGTFF